MNGDCKSLIDNDWFDTQLWAGVPGVYCCYDSGGPLTLLDGPLVGIVSNGIIECSN